MKLYFAPMEGLGQYRYRKILNRHFPGADRYFSPFVAPQLDGKMMNREMNDINPGNNEGVHLIPQILANRAEAFLNGAKVIADLGYQEINLNLGCPSGTVTKRGRGSGFLKTELRMELIDFLDEIFAKSPVPLSIKTRLGYEDPDDFYRLIEIFASYPLTELIIHPRTTKEMYGGTVHRDLFFDATKDVNIPIGYNGDIRSKEDYQTLLELEESGTIDSVMIGRGALLNPGIFSELIGKEAPTGEQLLAFHHDLYDEYKLWLQADAQLLQKLKEVWSFHGAYYKDCEKELKAIKKAKTSGEYWIAVNQIIKAR